MERRARAIGLIATMLAVATLAAACSSGGAQPVRTKTVTASPSNLSSSATASSPATSSVPPTSSSPSRPPAVVHVTSMQSDGATYGVGMPIVLFFSPAPTDSSAFTKAVKVTVNGHPAAGAWFWEQPTQDEVRAHTYEAHYRMRDFWPAHSRIHVDVPIAGLSAGKGLVYSGRLTSLDFRIGPKHVSMIDAARHRMRVMSDGKLVRTIPVSLGAARTPTYHGIKVVMQKGEAAPGRNGLRSAGAVRMRGPGYDELVDWSVRITRSGEYIHAAPWNSRIGQMSTSNGCTNLFTQDAKWYYRFALLGDVAIYPNADGPLMPSWDGFGDWNVTWPVWSRGGLLVNH